MKTWPVVVAIVIVGAGIVAAIVLTRPEPDPGPAVAPTSPGPAVSPSPQPTITNSPSPISSPSPSPTAAPSAGVVEAPITDLRLFRAQIHRFVRETFDELMCGYPPTDAELDEWTNYVIRTGNRLQPDLPWEVALAEAEARAYEALYDSPEAEFFRDAPQCQ